MCMFIKIVCVIAYLNETFFLFIFLQRLREGRDLAAAVRDVAALEPARQRRGRLFFFFFKQSKQWQW